MGHSRDTFCRYKQAVDEGDFEALVEKNCRKPNLRNRTAPEIEAAILELTYRSSPRSARCGSATSSASAAITSLRLGLAVCEQGCRGPASGRTDPENEGRQG